MRINQERIDKRIEAARQERLRNQAGDSIGMIAGQFIGIFVVTFIIVLFLLVVVYNG